MPRGPRLDTPETLNHVTLRGIEKRKIDDDDDKDRENFVSRMGTTALDTKTSIYSSALNTVEKTSKIVDLFFSMTLTLDKEKIL